jgi:hypothetical protein
MVVTSAKPEKENCHQVIEHAGLPLHISAVVTLQTFLASIIRELFLKKLTSL